MNPTHCPTCKRKYTTSDKAKAYRKALRAEKQKKSAAHRMSTKQIRAACVERADGFCELGVACAVPNGFNGSLEWHHLEGGSGRRREKQAVSNTLMACRGCHQDFHRRPQDFTKAIARWAALYNYPIPSRFKRTE